jgi:hypothetical protein
MRKNAQIFVAFSEKLDFNLNILKMTQNPHTLGQNFADHQPTTLR